MYFRENFIYVLSILLFMKRILIMAGTGIGNMVQATPAIQAISTIYSTDLVLSLNYRESICLFRSLPGPKKIFSLYEDYYLKKIKLSDYDKLICLKHEPFVEKYRVNYYKKQPNFFPIQYSQTGSKNDVELNMEAAQALGYNGEIPKPYVYAEKSDLDLNYKYVFCPGCSSEHVFYHFKNKKWSRWHELAKMLAPEKIAIIGTLYDFPPHKEIRELENVHDYRGFLTIQQSVNLINSSENIIAIDNGLAQIAAALDKKVFVLFGPTIIRKCLPWGDNVFVIKKEISCSPCQETRAFIACNNNVCMDIDPKAVYDMIKQEI